MPNLLQEDETYKIIGAAMAVHSELGQGFLEAIYQEAMAIEFQKMDIPFEKEKLLNVYYKGKKLKKHYSADFLCYDSIIVELKALKDLSGDHQSQLLNYLKATENEVGLLINFGKKSLEYKRMILTK